ncbi:MAG: hypothetical protein ABEJ78_08835 [Haloferacaceae archaeon]
MWASRSGRVATAVVLALVVLATGTPFALALTPDAAAQQRSPSVFAQQGVDTDSVRLVVAVDANGTASWEVQYWTRLDDENTTAAFESLQSDIESNPENYTERFASRMRGTVAAAENSTGREMNATDFAVTAETRTPPQYGVVIYSFEWVGFAAVEGDTLRVGDAIEGIFLDEQTRLVVEWPTDYAVTDIAPEADERRTDAVVWRGSETSFVSGEPRIVLTRGEVTTTGDGTGGSDGGVDGDGGADGDGTPDGDGTMLALVVGLLALGVVGVVAWRRRERLRTLVGVDSGTTVKGEATGETADGGAEAAAVSETPDEDLLSNEERVLKFVEDQGGRVKQQEIVQAFDWTEARTSQILRDLRDEGQLEGFRLGRENVLKLPDDEE